MMCRPSLPVFIFYLSAIPAGIGCFFVVHTKKIPEKLFILNFSCYNDLDLVWAIYTMRRDCLVNELSRSVNKFFLWEEYFYGIKRVYY